MVLCGQNTGRNFCLLPEPVPSIPPILDKTEPSTFSTSGMHNTEHHPNFENEDQVDSLDPPDVFFENPIELLEVTESQRDDIDANTDNSAGDEKQLSEPDTFSAKKKCKHSLEKDLVFGNDKEFFDYSKKVTNIADVKSVLNVQQSTEDKYWYIEQNHHTTNTGSQLIVNNAFSRSKHFTAFFIFLAKM